MKRLWLLLGPAVLAAGCQKSAPPSDPNKPNSSFAFSSARKFPLKDLKESTIKVDGKEIKVWVMDDEAKRAEGFMYLDASEVQDNHGMIFMFPKPDQQSFWMHNCIMSLDIAYIGADKKVLNVVVGKQQNDTPLPSKGPAKYVLELKVGEAAPLGVKPGATVEIPSDIETKQ